MNKLCCLIILLLTCKICNAQNLVPNGDFEQYVGCPITFSDFDSVSYWIQPTDGTPDYYNQCANDTTHVSVPNNWVGYQQPHSGFAYAGLLLYAAGAIYNNHREYIEVPLNLPLIANSCYYFEMYVNLGNFSKYTTDDIGVYFSDTLVDSINSWFPLAFIPQINNTVGNITDTMNWTLISGNYIAAGGENYLLIGNFNDDAFTTTSIINSSGYIEAAYVLIDDVFLNACTVNINELKESTEINIYPNPVLNKLNVKINYKEPSEVTIYDIASRKLLQQKFTNTVSLNTEQLAKGIYLYEVRNKNGVVKKGKVVKQ